MNQKKILLLGATGSIGLQTIEIIEKFSKNFCLIGIAAGKNEEKLTEIQKKHKLVDSQVFLGQKNSPQAIKIFITNNPADIYINAISGENGALATEEIIKQQNPLCLANKESLVGKGEKIMREKKCEIFPIDSELSSIENLLTKVERKKVRKIWLTASGGAFLDPGKFPKESFSKLTKSQALNHPTWKMGEKITVDSATLMNKAFELIEAVRLFYFPVETYEVVIHPQSIVHAAIETKDGNIVMEASTPDMKLSIARCLFKSAKEEIPFEFSISPFSPFGKNLSFEKVDKERFPSIEMAKEALMRGEEKCEQFLQENDESVALFLEEKISFDKIFKRIKKIF